MTVADTARAAITRTRQDLAVLGVRYCANWYAQTIEQGLRETSRFDAIWTLTNLTVTANNQTDPRNNSQADTLDYTAATGNAEMISDFTAAGLTGDSYTGSVWMKTAAGTGTVTLRIRKSAGVEEASALVTVTTTWTRFSVAALAASNGGTWGFLVMRAAGDLAQVIAWGANLTRIPVAAAPHAVGCLFPTIERDTEVQGQLSIMASRCTAIDAGDGLRCNYSPATCQDQANFNVGNTYETTVDLQGLREWKFCRGDAPLPLGGGADYWPLLKGVSYTPAEVDAERSVTTSEEPEFVFNPMSAPPLWDPSKQAVGAKVNTASGNGSFWPRWLAVNKTYPNPAGYALYKEGFIAAGMTEALFDQRFKGPMSNFELDADGVATIRAIDLLSLLRRSAPSTISSDNLLEAAMNAVQTTMDITDATELSVLAANAASSPADYEVTLVVGIEKMNVKAIDLTVTPHRLAVTRAAWGTTAATHPINSSFSEVIEYGTERAVGFVPLGKNPMDCVIETFKRAGIVGIDTARLTLERNTWLPSTINITTGQETGALARLTVETKTDLEKLLTEFREGMQLFIVVGENQQITGRLFAPARPSETLVDLTDSANFVRGSLAIDDNDKSRITEALVAWDLIPGEKGNSEDDYFRKIRRIGTFEESPAGYGQARVKKILNRWMPANQTPQARGLAKRIIGRFRNGARILTFYLELKDSTLKILDFATINTAKLQMPDGAPVSLRQVMITSKKPLGANLYAYKALDTGLFRRYAWWCFNGTPDYPIATPEQRRYGFFGTDPNNRLNNGTEDGFYIWPA